MIFKNQASTKFLVHETTPKRYKKSIRYTVFGRRAVYDRCCVSETAGKLTLAQTPLKTVKKLRHFCHFFHCFDAKRRRRCSSFLARTSLEVEVIEAAFTADLKSTTSKTWRKGALTRNGLKRPQDARRKFYEIDAHVDCRNAAWLLRRRLIRCESDNELSEQ